MPLASVIIPCFNSALYIEEAINSALQQTLRDLEVVVVDDCSTDLSYRILEELAAKDSRVRIFKSRVNRGPSATRNRCINEARGKWLVILDADDLMHPDRVRALIFHAEQDNADIVADDLVIFSGENKDFPDKFSGKGRLRIAEPFWVDPVEYVKSNTFYSRALPLGYLKPVIRANRLPMYDDDLRLAEDYDMIIRMLVKGAKMRVYSEVMYYYRRHQASLSHRLSRKKLEPMIVASEEFYSTIESKELRAALEKRHESILRALAFEDLVVSIHERKFLKAICISVTKPSVLWLLYFPIFMRVHLLRKKVPWDNLSRD